MQPELVARLRRVMRGENRSANGVTGVDGVADASRYARKLAELRQLRPLRLKDGKLGKSIFEGVVSGVAARSECDEAAILERTGMCAECVPAIYLDGWARLNCHKPARVTEEAWRLALDDGGRFLDSWGMTAAGLHWPAGTIFDAPCQSETGGLIWNLQGASVESIVLDRARLNDGRVLVRPLTGAGHV